MKGLTIFTPTYNRVYILPQLYDSLCRQTSKNFVWLIVDDGSTDNTEALVNSWISESKIAIEYYKQANGGKMRAHNLGVQLCKTPLFTCVDSDDYLTDDAVEHIICFWKNNNREGEHLAGFIGYKSMIFQSNDEPKITCRFPSIRRGKSRDLYRKYGFVGDTAMIFDTDVIKKYPFPVVDGEKFITEAAAYALIDSHYDFLYCDESFQICEYQQDGYTVNSGSLYLKYPKGWAMYYNILCGLGKSEYSLKEQLRNLIYYIVFSKIGNLKDIFHHSNDKSLKYLIAWCLVPYYKYKLLKKLRK